MFFFQNSKTYFLPPEKLARQLHHLMKDVITVQWRYRFRSRQGEKSTMLPPCVAACQMMLRRNTRYRLRATDTSPPNLFFINIRLYFSLSFSFRLPSLICLSILHGVPSVGTALLTDASLWAKKHPSVSSSLPGLRQFLLDTCSYHCAPSLAPAPEQEHQYEDVNLAQLFFFFFHN